MQPRHAAQPTPEQNKQACRQTKHDGNSGFPTTGKVVEQNECSFVGNGCAANGRFQCEGKRQKLLAQIFAAESLRELSSKVFAGLSFQKPFLNGQCFLGLMHKVKEAFDVGFNEAGAAL
jgi:hypothetical protein